MDPATITPANIEALSSIALQYGPFFFAILFILFIPVLGQKWFFQMLQANVPGGTTERDAAIRVYKFYWISGIVTGLALVGFSVLWWAYIQYTFSLANFNHQVAQDIHKRIFEGVVRGADDNDIFVYDFNDPQYRVYIYPLRNQTPMLVRFAVLFYKNPQTIPKFGYSI